MDRKDFLKNCAVTCLGGFGMTMLAQGCGMAKLLTGKITGDDLVINVSDFEIKKGQEVQFRKYVIVQNEQLQYPICVYRMNADEYSALWMRCTHQGTELQVFGERLQCPAHGSEFNNNGLVQNGPAAEKLRTFPITLEERQLKISLKAV
jgi:Rieske Fe-S protein